MRYEDLLDERKLYNAMKACAKGVGWKRSVQLYLLERAANLDALLAKLRARDFSFPPCRTFDVTERGKKRHIQAASLEERIVQKLLCEHVLAPALSRTLIYDNGAIIKGKGLSFSRRRMVTHLSRYYRRFGSAGYALCIDFKHYFAGIDREKLFEKLRAVITDADIFALVQALVQKGEQGLSLGAEISQILALWYPNEIDHYAKEVLRLHFYVRHVDDICILHASRVYLEECLAKIRVLCARHGIAINERKTHITKLEKGFTFLKVCYRLTGTGRTARTSRSDAPAREKRRLEKMRALCASGAMSRREARQQYKSWRGQQKRAQRWCKLKALDRAADTYFGGITCTTREPRKRF